MGRIIPKKLNGPEKGMHTHACKLIKGCKPLQKSCEKKRKKKTPLLFGELKNNNKKRKPLQLIIG